MNWSVHFLHPLIFNISFLQSEREQFKLWKATPKISPEDVGLFKKWKQEQGWSKKQLELEGNEIKVAADPAYELKSNFLMNKTKEIRTRMEQLATKVGPSDYP